MKRFSRMTALTTGGKVNGEDINGQLAISRDGKYVVIAGQEGSKMAGGGASGFFNSLRLFKDIESRWDISGFTKKPDEAYTADD